MTATTKLGITHVEPTDHVVGTSIADGMMFKVNDAFETIDDNIGAVICTSGTRPSLPYPSQVIYETDTRLVQIRNAANNAWIAVNTGIPVVSSTAVVTSPFTSQIVYDTSFGGLKQYNGSIWIIYDANTKWIFKASTTTRTSTTTLGNDPTFVFPVVANSAYAVEAFWALTGAQAPAGGFKSQFTGPAGSSLLWTNYGTSTATATSDYNVVVQGLGVTRSVSTQSVATMSLQPKGTLVVGGTAGDLTLQWAQDASNATGTALLGGSWMKLTRIA